MKQKTSSNPSTRGRYERDDDRYHDRFDYDSYSDYEGPSEDLDEKMEKLAVELPDNQKEKALKTNPSKDNTTAYNDLPPTYEEATANDQKKIPTDPHQESEEQNPGYWKALKNKFSRKRCNSDDFEQEAEALPEKFDEMHVSNTDALIP